MEHLFSWISSKNTKNLTESLVKNVFDFLVVNLIFTVSNLLQKNVVFSDQLLGVKHQNRMTLEHSLGVYKKFLIKITWKSRILQFSLKQKC